MSVQRDYNYSKPATPDSSRGPAVEEVRVTDPNTGGEKGQKLAELGAVDPHAVMEVAKVAGFGTKKYARYNFAKGYKWSLSYDAMQRHLHAFWGGEDRDLESGLYHLAHAAWHCLTLLTFVMRKRGTDDRMHHMVVQEGGIDDGTRPEQPPTLKSLGLRQNPMDVNSVDGEAWRKAITGGKF